MLDFDPFCEYYPGDSWRAKCIRSLRRFISIDARSQRTHENLKSLTVIKAETLRHLLFYPSTIHCFSRFRHFWEMLMLITYGMAFLIIPVHVAFVYEADRLGASKITTLVSIINFVYLMDIAINFLSGYQDPHTKKIVLERRKIASNYMRHYFWIDVLSSLPDRWIISWFYTDNELKGNDLDQCISGVLSSPLYASECMWDLLIMLSLLKFLQVPLFFKYLINLLEERMRSLYSIEITRNVLSLIFFFHLLVCLNFLIMRVFAIVRPTKEESGQSFADEGFWAETTDVEKYIICFFYTTSTLTLFASSIEELGQVDMSIAIIYSLIGAATNYWLVSQAYMYLTTLHGPAVRFQEVRYELMEYVAFKRIPKSVQSRILAYYDYIFRGRFYRRDEINALYMGELRHLITIETCQQHLLRNYLFKYLPDGLMHAIASCMVETIFLRNDIICRNDRYRGQKLYLIVHGTVAIYTQEGREVAHLHDGSMFGEHEFIQHSDSHSYMNYVAAEECNILVLHRNDFMRVMADSVELINQMRMLLRDEHEYE